MKKQRKFNLQKLWIKGGTGSCSSDGCLVLTSTSTYRRLADNEERVMAASASRMDGDLDVWEPEEESLGESIGQQLGADGFFQAFDFYAKGHRLVKSESEDSGVEMGSGEASPSTPSESDQSFLLDGPELPQKLNWPSPGKDVAETRVDAQSGKEEDWRDVVPQKVNTKLEQAMQRSKKARTSAGRPVCRMASAALVRRHSGGSLPSLGMGSFQAGALQDMGASMDTLEENWRHCQEPRRAPGRRRVKLAQPQLQNLEEDCQQEMEMEKDDPLVLPGQGLRYLEHVCQVLEKMAELQRNNRSLRRQKRAIQARLRGTASEQEICGAVPPLGASQPDLHLTHQTDAATGGPRVSFRERSMSTSDVGNLWDFAPIQGTLARPPATISAPFVSTPDLKDTPDGWIPSNVPYLRQKSEPSQWERVKELISKIARKAVDPPNTLRKASFYRHAQASRGNTGLENPRPAPRKAFLPNIVVKKQKKHSPPVQ
ncbi:hypothetical protein NDU88_003946 [Pleurodeles waltl]|uniref:DUF4657 domain-containing protein n=2 Tax=Pleurodeles waltl TaxID=8319 RepID=A0AAV7LIG2_PLEWA|nr:hypothetical protein NDU88_003946 [Pleurodeles waltl]